MTGYATQADLVERFGEDEIRHLTDRKGTGAIDTDVVDQALADAGETVDGYIGSRYTLPLANVAPVLSRLTADIARYYLYDEAATEQVAKRHDAAIATLKDIARGVLSLGVATAEAPHITDAPQFKAPPRVFGTDTLDDY